jgi:hypothetical protein
MENQIGLLQTHWERTRMYRVARFATTAARFATKN